MDDMEEVIYERYKELACAIIAQGINDWLKKPDATEYSLYKFINNCTMFNYLDLDREYVFTQVLKLKEKGWKSIRFYNYGKDYNIRNVKEESEGYEYE